MPADVGEIFERNLTWFGHASFRIQTQKRTLYIDPYRLPPEEQAEADAVLITHDHFDHFSPDDLKALSRRGTAVVAPATVAEHLRGLVTSVTPGDVVELDGADVRAVAAYNTNKLDSDGKPFHPRDAGWVGYVVTIGGFSIYHSGDTDVIPEMDQAAGVDVALLPVSGTYVMTATEAAEAARRISPTAAVPMHWGTLIGSRDDAEQFAREASEIAHILEPEHQQEG